jgi:hypothetical protein
VLRVNFGARVFSKRVINFGHVLLFLLYFTKRKKLLETAVSQFSTFLRRFFKISIWSNLCPMRTKWLSWANQYELLLLYEPVLLNLI